MDEKSKLRIYSKEDLKLVKDEYLPEVTYQQCMGADDEYLFFVSGDFCVMPTGFWCVKKEDYINGNAEFVKIFEKNYN